MTEEFNKDEQGYMAIASLGAIFGPIIPAVMWILKRNNFSDYAKGFLADMLNFELIVTIIGFVIGLTPGFIMSLSIGAVIWFVNLVISLRCYADTRARLPYSFPFNIRIVS